MTDTKPDLQREIESQSQTLQKLRGEVAKVIVG